MGRIGCCPGAGGLWPPCEPGDCCIALLDNNKQREREKKKSFQFYLFESVQSGQCFFYYFYFVLYFSVITVSLFIVSYCYSALLSR
jgi:hypothetical protein